MEGTPALRRASPADLHRLIEIKDRASAGWGGVPAEPGTPAHRIQESLFLHLLATGDVVVSVEQGAVAAFGAAIVREGVWYLSQLFADPAGQGRGAGSAILDRLLADAQGMRARCVISSDDRRAFGLYVSRGMLPGWIQIEMLRRTTPSPAPDGLPEGVEPLRAEDQPLVDELERAQRGFARTRDHAWLRAHTAGHAIRGREGDLLAFFYVRSDGRVGPLGAMDDRTLVRAVDAADALAGPEASWWVPSSAPMVLRRLLKLGYRPGSLTTFCTDAPLGPFDRTAIAGGALL